jgi:hypothetical protein
VTSILKDFRNTIRNVVAAAEADGGISHTVIGTPEYSLEDVEEVRRLWAEEFIALTDRTQPLTRTVGFEPGQLEEAIENASNASTLLTIIGYVIMIIYSAYELWPRPLVGLIGVGFVSLATGCGLGICAIAGVTFNATSTKVLPFLLLGLGVDDMFVLAMNYKWTNKRRPAEELTGQLMGVWGPSITNTSVANLVVFMIGSAAGLPMVVNFCTMAVVGIFAIFLTNFFMTTALLVSRKYHTTCLMPSVLVAIVFLVTHFQFLVSNFMVGWCLYSFLQSVLMHFLTRGGGGRGGGVVNISIPF